MFIFAFVSLTRGKISLQNTSKTDVKKHTAYFFPMSFDHMIYIFHPVNMVYSICWFAYLMHHYILGVNPIQSWHIILLMCYGIWFTIILLRIFTSIFIMDIGLYFSFLVVNLFSSIRIMLDILVSYLSDFLLSCIFTFLS